MTGIGRFSRGMPGKKPSSTPPAEGGQQAAVEDPNNKILLNNPGNDKNSNTRQDHQGTSSFDESNDWMSFASNHSDDMGVLGGEGGGDEYFQSYGDTFSEPESHDFLDEASTDGAASTMTVESSKNNNNTPKRSNATLQQGHQDNKTDEDAGINKTGGGLALFRNRKKPSGLATMTSPPQGKQPVVTKDDVGIQGFGGGLRRFASAPPASGSTAASASREALPAMTAQEKAAKDAGSQGSGGIGRFSNANKKQHPLFPKTNGASLAFAARDQELEGGATAIMMMTQNKNQNQGGLNGDILGTAEAAASKDQAIMDVDMADAPSNQELWAKNNSTQGSTIRLGGGEQLRLGSNTSRPMMGGSENATRPPAAAGGVLQASNMFSKENTDSSGLSLLPSADNGDGHMNASATTASVTLMSPGSLILPADEMNDNVKTVSDLSERILPGVPIGNGSGRMSAPAPGAVTMTSPGSLILPPDKMNDTTKTVSDLSERILPGVHNNGVVATNATPTQPSQFQHTGRATTTNTAANGGDMLATNNQNQNFVQQQQQVRRRQNLPAGHGNNNHGGRSAGPSLTIGGSVAKTNARAVPQQIQQGAARHVQQQRSVGLSKEGSHQQQQQQQQQRYLTPKGRPTLTNTPTMMQQQQRRIVPAVTPGPADKRSSSVKMQGGGGGGTRMMFAAPPQQRHPGMTNLQGGVTQQQQQRPSLVSPGAVPKTGHAPRAMDPRGASLQQRRPQAVPNAQTTIRPTSTAVTTTKNKNQASSSSTMMDTESFGFEDMHAQLLVDLRDLQDTQLINQDKLLEMENIFSMTFSSSLSDQAAFLDLVKEVEKLPGVVDDIIETYMEF